MSTHNIPFQYKKENHPKLSQICSYGIFSKGLKNEFDTAVVNGPSMFESLKVYCTSINVNLLVFWNPKQIHILIVKVKHLHLNSVYS